MFFIVLVIYGFNFAHLDKVTAKGHEDLPPLAPSAFYDITGYLKQLTAEVLFIRTKVFLGGDVDSKRYKKNIPTLSDYYKQVADMHPYFLDTYFMTETTLAWVSPDSAKSANEILEVGAEYRDDTFLFPFFMGFNYFRHLNNPKQASHWLKKAAEFEGAPTWFGHLAAILDAKGGDISGGLIWLKAMARSTQEPSEKARYLADIKEYEKAMIVFNAIERYREKTGAILPNLESLIPEFLPRLPQMKMGFHLIYKDGELRLQK
jgi:hypothetical protein